jgi:N utilization substance protein B
VTEAGPRGDERHRSREAALQMLYAWEVGGLSEDDLSAVFWAEHGDALALSDAGRRFAERLVRGTIADLAAIDPLIAAAADNWRLSRLAIVDRLVLRLAVHELRHDPDTPAPVVINEALELARTFSGDEAVGFVNGVLDGIRKTLTIG